MWMLQMRGCNSQTQPLIDCNEADDQRPVIWSDPFGIFSAWGLWALCEYSIEKWWLWTSCDREIEIFEQKYVWTFAVSGWIIIHDSETVRGDANYWKALELMGLKRR